MKATLVFLLTIEYQQQKIFEMEIEIGSTCFGSFQRI